LRVQAHYGQGATLFHMGRLEEARGHLEAALREYDPVSHREHVTVYGGFDPGVACRVWIAWTLVLQGRLEDAAPYDTEGLALARRHGDEFTLAWTCTCAGITRHLLGEWQAAERFSAEAAALAEEHGFPYPHGFALTWRGWCLVLLGKVSLGIGLIREGLAELDTTGTRITRPWYLAMLGEAEALDGEPAALRRFDEALDAMNRSGERYLEAIVLTGKAKVLALTDPTESGAQAGEACLRRALAVAASQGAHLLELRAAVALARHLRAHGRDPEGFALLSAAYAPFVDTRISAPE